MSTTFRYVDTPEGTKTELCNQSELIRSWAAKHWQIKGRKLKPPHVIARRLLAWPFMKVAQCILVVIVAAGWGIDEAKQTWNDLT